VASFSGVLVAIRADGILPANFTNAGPARGPDTRTMAIALGGRPVESAKMVWSRGCIAYLLANGREGNAQFVRAYAAPQQSANLAAAIVQQFATRSAAPHHRQIRELKKYNNYQILRWRNSGTMRLCCSYTAA
jgi:hypothetical protein